MQSITKYSRRFATSSPTAEPWYIQLFRLWVSYYCPQMSPAPQTKPELLGSVRLWLSLFLAGLILSGLTAFPLEQETAWLASFLETHSIFSDALTDWVARVHAAILDTNLHYPFLAYGTDWLGFPHLALAIAFIGPLRDPVRNKWVLQFGVITCMAVIPLALIA